MLKRIHISAVSKELDITSYIQEFPFKSVLNLLGMFLEQP